MQRIIGSLSRAIHRQPLQITTRFSGSAATRFAESLGGDDFTESDHEAFEAMDDLVDQYSPPTERELANVIRAVRINHIGKLEIALQEYAKRVVIQAYDEIHAVTQGFEDNNEEDDAEFDRAVQIPKDDK
eukprot:TRINITY_DN356_c0_g1_i3.p2 TRINITY_DN356_c0_g1~~TRINITY_DN356_c0_g1_i3.p2  ORF type:complete len:130 (+),score=28.60 TRINITY_DN356_c0_g1_i3:3-392(+)